MSQLDAKRASATPPSEKNDTQPAASVAKPAKLPPEHGGPKGPEPTRYGDWESKGRCIDF